MNISFSEFEEQEYNDFLKTFVSQAQELTKPPDEIMLIDELLLGVQITYDDILKLMNTGKMSFKSMIYFVNYIQKRSNIVNHYFLGYFIKELDLVNQLNPMLEKYFKKGDPVNYIFIFYWVDRWLVSIFNLKTTIIDIVDLQKNKTKDDLKKYYEQLLKKKGMQKVSFKTVNYVYQEDKTTDGGMYVINFLYQTQVKEKPFQKLTPEQKINLKKHLLWLFFRGEKSQHVDYPNLPPLTSYNEQEVKQYQLTNLEPFLTAYWTGIEVQQSDFELLQKSGKSQPHMVAFWLSYLYYFDLQSQNPLLPFFVIARNEEIFEEFELIFKPRRKQGVDNQRIIILMFIRGSRWVFCVYHIFKKTLDIVDLQNKNVTKEDLLSTFEKLIQNLVTSYENPQINYIFQGNTDSTDGTEYVINTLWQYINGTQLDKIKFGFSEKRLLRQKLVWVLIKLQSTPISSAKSIQIPSKKKIPINLPAPSPQASQTQSEVQNTPQASRFGRFKNANTDSPQQKSSKTIEEQTPKKTFISSFRNKQPQNTQSPMNSPSKSMISDQKSESQEPPSKKSSLFSRKQPDLSPKSQTSETSIQISKPVKKGFGAKKTVIQAAAKLGMLKGGSAAQQQEPIIETQKSEEYDEDEFSDLFHKKKQSIENTQEKIDNSDKLFRIQEELTEYYHELLDDEKDNETDALRVQEIFKLNKQILQTIEKKKNKQKQNVLDQTKSQVDGLSSFVYNSQLQNYSTIVHDDRSVLRMIYEMVQGEEQNESKEEGILKKRKFIEDEIDQIDLSVPHVDYELPNKSQQDKRSSASLPAIRRNTSELFKKSNLVGNRYGVKLEVPLLQQFYKDGKMNNQMLNFLIKFIEEKHGHQKQGHHVFNYYNTSIKFFPTQFYQILCFNLLHSTFRINYFEANQFTFENTGQGDTIFDVYDWLVIPIAELPTEYSVVFVNLKRKVCYCYILSSLIMRVRDPIYINPEKNPYMKNIISFLQYEFEIKLKKPRDELGRFSMQFGIINDNNNFGQSINYDYSGIYTIYIIIHLAKYGHNSEIKIDTQQAQLLKKSFHDLIVRIGYNEDDNLFHLLEENQFPF